MAETSDAPSLQEEVTEEITQPLIDIQTDLTFEAYIKDTALQRRLRQTALEQRQEGTRTIQISVGPGGIDEKGKPLLRVEFHYYNTYNDKIKTLAITIDR